MDREKQIEEMHLEFEKWDDADTESSLSEWLYNAGYRKASEVINEFSEELIKRFNDLEYKANTPRKTIKVDELRAQMDWILHEVAVNTIKEFAEKYVEAMK